MATNFKVVLSDDLPYARQIKLLADTKRMIFAIMLEEKLKQIAENPFEHGIELLADYEHQRLLVAIVSSFVVYYFVVGTVIVPMGIREIGPYI